MTSITAFTPASSCFAPTYTVAPAGNDTVENLTAVRGYATECMAFTPEPTGYPTMEASSCLDGYEQLSGMESINGQTTYGTCCPSGMTVQSTSTQLCSSVTGYNSVTVINATQTSMVHANFLVAPALVMAYTAQDALTTSHPTPYMVPTTSSSIPSTAVPVSPTATPDSNGINLNTTSHRIVLAICVTVGCLIVFGIIAAVIAFVLARKGQQKKAKGSHGQAVQDLPPAYEARSSQSIEELPGYLAGSKTETFDIK